MSTSKPISTISYNSENFLKLKLEELVSNHKLADYKYIRHYAEEDEAKDHFHVLLIPNCVIDPMDIQDFLKEFDPNNPKKPLGCIYFNRTSDVDEWLLYVMHFPAYLESKGQNREFIYSKDDFRYHDDFAFERDFHHAFHGSKWALEQSQMGFIRDLLNNKIEPVDAFGSGSVPINKAPAVNSVVNMQMRFLNRNGRSTHSPKNSSN